MPTTLTNGIQLPDKGSVDWYNSMQSNYNLIDTHLGNTDTHVTAEDKANWNSKQGSLSQAQLDAIAQVATNTSDIATLQSGKANASHTHSSSDITDIGDYATKQYVDNSISGLVDNAPAALDTLKELSTALNDDANFASTVTTALAAKANSADLATVATSGSYTDLDDKPTINDSTITIQKNGSTVDTFTTNGSAKTINIPVPTKTSDLTNDSNFVVSSSLATVATSGFYNDLDNKPYIPDKISDLIDDSNFVDTSNPAVASGITSAKVTDYDNHIADTDIHVTTADKTKWNNQTFVFRYSSTALVASSTNSNTLLDNTDNLKVGDKVIDSNGVLFSITAIDNVNSTFTVGSALVDLALDANVVHTSGNETVGGVKTFSNDIRISKASPFCNAFSSGYIKGQAPTSNIYSGVRFFDDINSGSTNNITGGFEVEYNKDGYNKSYISSRNYAEKNHKLFTVGLRVPNDDIRSIDFLPSASDIVNLGTSTNKWKAVYATNYYYGSNNVEFSTKFVTTDTAQTIEQNKTFTGVITINHTKGGIFQLTCPDLDNTINVTGNWAEFISFNSVDGGQTVANKGSVGLRQFKNGKNFALLLAEGGETLYFGSKSNSDSTKAFYPANSGVCSLGTSTNKWATINGLNPSSLSMPDYSSRIDISSYVTNLNGAYNAYTPSVDGWIAIQSSDATFIRISDTGSGGLGNTVTSQTAGTLTCMLPVRANRQNNIYIVCTTLTSAYFIPCQGNV